MYKAPKLNKTQLLMTRSQSFILTNLLLQI